MLIMKRYNLQMPSLIVSPGDAMLKLSLCLQTHSAAHSKVLEPVIMKMGSQKNILP